MSIGEKIRKIRGDLGYSQEKLSELVKVSRQTISNWELDETLPNTEQLVSLSKVLKISIDELVNNKIEYLNKRIDNAEKKINKDIKITKIIFITLYFIILIGIIFFIVYILNKKDFTNYYDSEFYCYNKDEKIEIFIEEKDSDEYYIMVTSYEEKYYAGKTIDEVLKNMNVVKKVLINDGYVCKPM